MEPSIEKKCDVDPSIENKLDVEGSLEHLPGDRIISSIMIPAVDPEQCFFESLLWKSWQFGLLLLWARQV